MCLNSITKTIEGTPEESGIGYKCYRRNDEYFVSIFGHGRLGEKFESYQEILFTERDKKQYISGFHIFLSLDDAKRWENLQNIFNTLIIKVKYSQGRLKGLQGTLYKHLESDEFPCIVADKIELVNIVSEYDKTEGWRDL